MEAMRTIQTVKNGIIHLDLPEQFWGKEVEVIVLSMPQENKPHPAKKSLCGCLKQYAKPELINLEKSAWQEMIREKHEHC